MSTSKTNIQDVLDSTSKTIYTASGTSEISLGSLLFYNRSVMSQTVDVFFVPSGETKGDEHKFFTGSVAAGSSVKPSQLIAEVVPTGTAIVVDCATVDVINYRGWAQVRSF